MKGTCQNGGMCEGAHDNCVIYIVDIDVVYCGSDKSMCIYRNLVVCCCGHNFAYPLFIVCAFNHNSFPTVAVVGFVIVSMGRITDMWHKLLMSHAVAVCFWNKALNPHALFQQHTYQPCHNYYLYHV